MMDLLSDFEPPLLLRLLGNDLVLGSVSRAESDRPLRQMENRSVPAVEARGLKPSGTASRVDMIRDVGTSNFLGVCARNGLLLATHSDLNNIRCAWVGLYTQVQGSKEFLTFLTIKVYEYHR